MTDHTDPLDDFLVRLHVATAELPPEIRQDLLQDLATHLDEIRRTSRSAAEVQTALDRLGPPDAIVQAAVEEAGLTHLPAPPVSAPRRPGIGREVVTAILTVFGVPLAALLFRWFPPLTVAAMAVAFIAGLALLWTSRVWTPGEKLLGTLVWPGGVGLPLFIGTSISQVCTTVDVLDETLSDAARDVLDQGAAITTCTGFSFPPLVGIPLFLILVAAPIIVGAALLRRAQRRTYEPNTTEPRGDDRAPNLAAPGS